MTNSKELFESLVEIGQHPKEYTDTVIIMEEIGHFLDNSVRKIRKDLKKIELSKFMETHQTSLVISLLIFIFALIHSGGAALRIKAESIMGARLWRLCFVFFSLPSAIILISYFLAHRYDGVRLWNFQGNSLVL